MHKAALRWKVHLSDAQCKVVTVEESDLCLLQKICKETQNHRATADLRRRMLVRLPFKPKADALKDDSSYRYRSLKLTVCASYALWNASPQRPTATQSIHLVWFRSESLFLRYFESTSHGHGPWISAAHTESSTSMAVQPLYYNYELIKVGLQRKTHVNL